MAKALSSGVLSLPRASSLLVDNLWQVRLSDWLGQHCSRAQPFQAALASCWSCRADTHSYHTCPACHQKRSFSDQQNFEWVGGMPNPAPRASVSNVDTDFRSATDVVWPATRQQQKVASKVQTALGLAFMDPARRELFMDRLGLSILEVRMSPDHMTAFVLWEAHDSEVDATMRALKRNMRDIRGAMARRLHAKHIPRLEFRYNTLTDAQQEVEDELQRLQMERQLEELQSGS